MLSRHRTSSVQRLLRFVLSCITAFILCLSHITFISLLSVNGKTVTAQIDYANHFNYKSIENYSKNQIQKIIENWRLELVLQQKNQNFAEAAVTLEKIAKAYDFIGESESSIKYWQQASLLYSQINDLTGLGQSKIRQAQVYRSLGQVSIAMTLAQEALDIARTYNDNNLLIAALGSRGEAYHLQGKYKLAIADFQIGLNLSSKINSSYYKICLFNSLGRVYLSLARVNYGRVQSMGDEIEQKKWSQAAFDDDVLALKALQQSYQLAKASNEQQLQINSLVSAIPAASRIYQPEIVQAKLREAILITSSLPDSRFKVYALIKLAQLVKIKPFEIDLSITNCSQSIQKQQLIASSQLLNQAIIIAQSLKSDDTLAFAFGNLGHIYECRQEYQQALALTKKAQLLARKLSSSGNYFYLWSWQEARIFKQLNQIPQAILAYKQALNDLENIRTHIVIYNQDLQLELHNSIEPLYRQFIQITLNLIKNSQVKLENTENRVLNDILPVIDKLKLIEIQKYFGKESLVKSFDNPNKSLEISNPNTAIFCSVIFKKRTAIIASFPNGVNKLNWINIDSQTLKKEINQYRIGLERRSELIYKPHQSKKLYDWIIFPVLQDLNSSQIKTLVFIHDGILRTVPMTALHDGKQYLIEKYSIANTPSLSLTNMVNVKRDRLQVLSAGLTKDAIINGQVYDALNYVDKEINQISKLFPHSKKLFNENFTYQRLQSELQQTAYPIIHIATHAEFSSILEDTFLVTGNNKKLTISQLDQLIRSVITDKNSVDLLALTACETATGDEAAALGLAGVAVKAGVKSTLASLWSINDAATVNLIINFYQEWYNNKFSKVEALQKAQQQMITQGGKYAHPYYWASFVLIGNWL